VNRKPQSRDSPISWRIALAFAGGGLLLLLLTVGLLWLVQNQPQTPAETIVVLISILTLLVLGFAVGALGFILRSAVFSRCSIPSCSPCCWPTCCRRRFILGWTVC